MEKTSQEKIVQDLKHKLAAAEAGKVEAFWSVDIQRNSAGEPVPTLTIIIDAPATDDQLAAMQEQLRGIFAVMRDIYKGA